MGDEADAKCAKDEDGTQKDDDWQFSGIKNKDELTMGKS
jgi:hypothetical protein